MRDSGTTLSICIFAVGGVVGGIERLALLEKQQQQQFLAVLGAHKEVIQI